MRGPTHRTRGSTGVLGRVLAVLGVVLAVAGLPARSDAQPGDEGAVYVVDISGTIDLGLAPYLERVLDRAGDDGAAAVLVEIDTPGGRLDAVLQMRDTLLDATVPTIAFVDTTAFSAGALVAIACEQIYMAPGSVMGAATPVRGDTGEVADAKTISAVRATFEATAEERGRAPEVAAAMVDPDVAVDGLVDAGQLLTLTVSQAGEVGYADGVVADRDALLAELGLTGREVIETSPTLAERLVRVITDPVVASLLLSVGLLLVIGDLLTGGIGVGLAAGAALLALFFWGHMLAGLAGWEDAALLVLGLALIAVEVFVVPGFGVPGVLGLLALMGGAFLAMLYRDFDFVTRDAIERAAVTVGVTLVIVLAGLIALLVLLSRRGLRGGLVLDARLGVGPPVTERAHGGWLRWFDATARLDPGTGAGDTPARPAEQAQPLVGAFGTALSDLRPSGVADIGGERVDVVTSGEYLRAGEPIEVVRDEGYRRVVRRRAT